MTIRSLTYTALVAAVLSVAACSGTANISVPNATINASGQIQDAFKASDSSAQLQTVVGTDAMSYRAENDTNQSDVWYIYYYSPSKNKSYKCTERSNSVTSIVEITDAASVYRTDYKIEKEKVKVDVSQAKVTAVAAANANTSTSGSAAGTTAGASASTSSNVNVSTFNSAKLISAKECQEKTGKTVDGPVYAVSSVSVNVTVYVSASSGNVVATTNTSTSTSTTTGSGTTSTSTNTNTSTSVTTGTGTTPSVAPSMMPSAMPSAAASTMPSTMPSTTATVTPSPART